MQTNPRRWNLLLAAAVATGLVASALLSEVVTAQTVLYSDSFDRTTGSGDPNNKPADPDNFSSWGENDNASGGTLVNTWTTGPSRGGGANQVTDGSFASTVEGAARYPVDITGMAASGFVVEFDFNRFSPFNPPDPFGTNNGFLSVGLGTDSDAGLGGGQFNVNNADFTLLFQQAVGNNTGNTQFFEDSAFLAGTDSEGPVDYGDPLATHSVELTMVPAVTGQYGETDTVHGMLRIDGGTPFSFSVLGGTEFGVLSFASNGFVHRIYDNLVVTALASTGTPGDADGDNDVDGTDFLVLQRDNLGGIAAWEANFGTLAGGASFAAVPEPAALMLGVLVFGGISLLRRR
jgi:hypothetical protein